MYRQLHRPWRRATLSQAPEPSNLGQLKHTASYPVVNLHGWGPSSPHLGANPGQSSVRRPLLGQELEVTNERAWDVQSWMARLLRTPECLVEIESKHGRPAIDALLNKAVQISQVDRQRSMMGLTSQEVTLLKETIACLHPDPIGFGTVLAVMAVLGLAAGGFAWWLSTKRPQYQ